jgi:putative ABC transport system permease protein
MLITHLKIFLWNLTHHKTIAAIKILGLAFGLASYLLITLYVLDELSYDSQHRDAGRLYRVSWLLTGLEQGRQVPIPATSPQVGALLQQNFAEVEGFTRMASESVYLSLNDNGKHDAQLQFVDANFFDFFQFTWVQGNPVSALSQPDSIVLTESLARYYFGDTDPMGKVLLLQQAQPLKVTGLISDLKNNTHIDGEAFVTMNSLERLLEPGAMEDWFESSFQTYVRLQTGVVFSALQPALHAFLDDSLPPAANAIYDPDSIAVRDIHLRSHNVSGQQDVHTLMMVGMALLAIACLNFVNLATAHVGERGKEIAVRKVLGAARGQILWQHLLESGGVVALSLLLALGISELSLPLLNAFTSKELSLSTLPVAGLIVLAAALLIMLLAGAAPAAYLATFPPLAGFKRLTWHGASRRGLSNLFVILQFAIAIVLIIGTFVIRQQIQYAKQLEFGFNKDQVLIIENELGDNWDVIKQRLQADTSVAAVSGAQSRPFSRIATSISARHEGGSTQGENLSFAMVDFGYFELFEVALLAGRTFSPSAMIDKIVQPTDDNPHTNTSFMLNRAMVEKLGWSVDESIGKQFELNWSTDYSRSIVGQVIGVVENMRVDSLHNAVTPLLYMVPSSLAGLRYGLVKIAATDLAVATRTIDTVWREVYPDKPINRYLLDTKFQALYSVEERQAAVLGVFALLAIAIACMGLFGLATLTTEQRSKEVGIRKTFGSSVWQIVLLLTNNFSRLVLLSNLIAWPVAYFAMERWLQNFAYRIELTPVVFVGSGLIALCIAWVTVGGTAAKAAGQKPVLALRYE